MQSPYDSEEFFQQILVKAVAASASDVHLKVGQPPGARIRGDMVYFKTDKLKPEDTEAMARHVIKDPAVKRDLAQLKEHDTSYSLRGASRFRVNVYRQRGSLAIVMRAIPQVVPGFEALGAPAACRSFCEKDRGLVLVVGAAGNGKSSTLAAMMQPRQRNNPGAEPLMSRRRQHPRRELRSTPRAPAGYWAQHVCKERRGTRETRLRSGSHRKRVRISRRRNRTRCSGSPRGS